MKVRNFVTNRGNAAANQFIIEDGLKTIFQSYNSIIAVKEKGEVTLDKHRWDYSNTTGKYRNMFLGETKAETERKIKEGIYKLACLN